LGTQVGSDQNIVFANSDPANTQVPITFTKPTNPIQEYDLIVYNPSTVTDLTVKLYTIETSLGGGDRDAYITSVSVPKSQSITGTTINCYKKSLAKIFNNGNFKIVVSNDTVLGGSDGFTSVARLRAS